MSTVESIARPRRNGERRRAPTASISKESPAITGVVEMVIRRPDRKSGSAGMPRPSSYAVVCLKKKRSWEQFNDSYEMQRPAPTATLFPYTTLFRSTMRDIKSKNVYSRVNSKATTQWRKTESANGVHLEGVASDNRSS